MFVCKIWHHEDDDPDLADAMGCCVLQRSPACLGTQAVWSAYFRTVQLLASTSLSFQDTFTAVKVFLVFHYALVLVLAHTCRFTYALLLML